jgi:two-component system sensor histidine kinase HydH
MLITIFKAALIANTALLIILLALGGRMYRASEALVYEMGRLTLQSLRAARPMFWDSGGLNSPLMRSFINQLAEQDTVKNVFVYNDNKNIFFAYKTPLPWQLIDIDSEISFRHGSSLYMYDVVNFGGRHMGGMGRRGNILSPYIICLEVNSASVTHTAALLRISMIIAALMEAVLLLFYVRLKQMLTIYQQSQKNLQIVRQEATTGRFANILAHEIKNPLSSIKGFVDYSMKKSNDSQIKENLERSLDEVDRLAGIVDGFLTFGRAVDLNRRLFNINDCALKSVSLLSYDFSSAGKNVSISGDGFEISADYDKLLQVFVNLLLNAMQALPAEGSAEMVLDSAFKKVLITNDVLPDAKVDTERLFEPFYTTKVNGSGLGMAISRKIMEIHGFEIYIESVSPFTVVLDFKV